MEYDILENLSICFKKLTNPVSFIYPTNTHAVCSLLSIPLSKKRLTRPLSSLGEGRAPQQNGLIRPAVGVDKRGDDQLCWWEGSREASGEN